MTAKWTSDLPAMALVVVAGALAAGNWYLRPERAVAWGSCAILIACMAAALVLASRRRSGEGAARAGEALRSGVVFAGSILTVSLGLKLATALGVSTDPDLARRTPFLFMGAFFVFTGNGMPKMLTPLSRLRCDAARVQSFQRFTGWTWVLTGLAIIAVWIVLPVDRARVATFVLLPSAAFVVVSQIVRLRRDPPAAAL